MSKPSSSLSIRGLGVRPLTVAVAAALGSYYSVGAFAQQGTAIEEIVVTATRRANTVQDIPINITAIGGNDLREQRLVGLDEIARVVPGLQIVDKGPRDEFTDILARGLNTGALGPALPSDTVAIYLGEVPLAVDLKTNDLERAEVLIGPQGTLYGSGTLGGAIRYIPRKPQDEFEAQFRGNMFSLDHSDGIGSDVGFTVNTPIIDNTLAFRASLDRFEDPGYIDYNYLVREPGVSNPQPDFADPADIAANLRGVKDANGEETLSARLGLRWTPTDSVDATLWYYYQDVDAEGRSMANVESFATGPYESGYRYLEPNNYRSELVALELTADLGFAELTSATGIGTFMERGQRDQTDLLLDLEYGYEFFPSFSGFTREIGDEDSTTQEFRLVSNGGGPLNWITGFFYSKYEQLTTSEEFTPNFDQYAVDNFGGVQLRPDALEYIELTDDVRTEKALYGELSYAFADDWEVTLGARLYEFEEELVGGFGLPLYYTVFLGYPQDFVGLDLAANNTDDSGSLFKLNLAHNFTDDILGYATVSEGYRIGGLNAVPECTPEQIASTTQQLCALPDEILIKADTTTNYELGVHSTLANGSLVLNAAVYYIDWNDVQVADTTTNGQLNITSNGGKAESKGVELSADWRIGSAWRLTASFAYNQAELAESTSGILGDSLTGDLFTPAGSRLPGSPEAQGTIGATYSTSLSNGWGLDVRYGISYMGDIANSLAAEQFPDVLPWRGEIIPSYTLQNLTIGLSSDQWTAAFYVDNLADEYAITGTRSSRRMLPQFRGDLNGFLLRSYGYYVGRPRTAGVSFTYDF